jgi:hypothetical protein
MKMKLGTTTRVSKRSLITFSEMMVLGGCATKTGAFISIKCTCVRSSQQPGVNSRLPVNGEAIQLVALTPFRLIVTKKIKMLR